MANVIEASRFLNGTTVPARSGGDGGGIVDDVLKRLNALETSVATITATLPHLATRADTAILPHPATKADLNAVQTDIRALEVAMIKWIIGTTITVTGVAFAIARFVV